MRVGIDARKIADFGIGTYIRGLLHGLVELGTDDEYVAFAPAGAPIPNGVAHAIVDAPHYSIRELVVVGRAADRAKLDVFHAPHYVVPFTKTPLVVTIHDLIHVHQPMRNPLAPLYARAMIRRAVRKARCVLTVTETVKGELEREFSAKNVIVTPNGVHVTRKPAARQAESLHYLYVGNDKPHKNVDTLIEAFARLRRELPQATLTLVGSAFDRFRDREGIDRRGFVSDEDLASLYAGAIALIAPSLEEGFGLPALEAMAHGTAVITSNAPALIEVTGDAALHVDARDVDALRDAMLRVARDARSRESRAQRGLDRARAFTWKRCAELTRIAYRRAM